MVHAQDCISANAVDRCVRTVHHLDTFTTPELAACHERAVVQPYAHVCVSAAVAAEVAAGWGIKATVIPNGVDAHRFATADPAELSRGIAGADGPVLLALHDERRQSLGDHLLAAAAPVEQVGEQDLGVHVDDATEQGVLAQGLHGRDDAAGDAEPPGDVEELGGGAPLVLDDGLSDPDLRDGLEQGQHRQDDGHEAELVRSDDASEQHVAPEPGQPLDGGPRGEEGTPLQRLGAQ